GSGEQMLSDTDDSELSSESSSSEEDCEDSDEYSTVDYSETETISATTNSRVTPALKWKEGAGKSLKRIHGNGSERTSRRKRKNLGELAQAASGCLDIGALFRRQQDLGIYNNCFRRKERRVRNGLGSTHGPWAGLGPLDQPTGNSWSSPFQWTEKSNPVQMFLSPVHLIWTGLNVMDRKVRSSPLDLGWADELDRKAWSSPFDLGSLRWTERYGPALSLSR